MDMDSEHLTLVISTVSTVTLAVTNADNVVVHMRAGTGPVYYTLDGSTPTVAGDGTYVVYSALPARSHPITTTDAPVVKLISATADAVSVEAF